MTPEEFDSFLRQRAQGVVLGNIPPIAAKAQVYPAMEEWMEKAIAWKHGGACKHGAPPKGCEACFLDMVSGAVALFDAVLYHYAPHKDVVKSAASDASFS